MTDSTDPPLCPVNPPVDETSRMRWLQLIRSYRVGPSTFLRLMGEFGDAQTAIEALPEIARKSGVARYRACSRADAEKEMSAGQTIGARLVLLGDANYPVLLSRVNDPPPVLWVRGQKMPRGEDLVALVGSRNASSLGTRMAKLLSRDLGRAGFGVVSGLARGVDAAAHLAALETGTLAVMAGGVDRIYPQENQKLAEEIIEKGTLISERRLGHSPQARDFPRRNRLISGMSRGVVVVEASAKSGSLITARDALDQGREVMAVPGHPLDPRAWGCNMLIRDGAGLVRGSKDVIEQLATAPIPGVPKADIPPFAEKPKATIPEALALSRKILSLLGPSPVAEDQLIRDLDLPAQAVSARLVALELEGKLDRRAGGLLSLVV